MNTNKETGIFVRGLCVSSTAVVRTRRKDSSTFVIIREEIALRPGLVVMERFIDPREDSSVMLDGGNVIKYPKLEDFEEYEINVKRFETDREGHLVIKDGLVTRIEGGK